MATIIQHEISFDGGKYLLQYTEGPNGILVQRTLRYGDYWRNHEGDNLMRHLVTALHDAKVALRSREADVLRMGKQLDALLKHCSICECGYCAVILCPHDDPMHFHHDGCPSCAQAEDAAEAVLAAASPN